MDKAIILVGLPGAGKSSIGKRIAKKYQCPFIDTDTCIEAQINMSIAEFFQNFGEAKFREIETQTLDRLMTQQAVIATGGGMVLSEKNRQTIRQQSICVYLDASIETIYKRIKQNTTRPLLQVDDPLAALRQIKKQREAFYLECAHIVVDANTTNVEQICQNIYLKISDEWGKV